MPAPGKPRRLGFLLLDGFDLGGFALPAEAFAEARRRRPEPGVRIAAVGLTSQPARARCGALVAVQQVAGESLDHDLLFVCGGEAATRLDSRELLDWLRRLARFGTALAGLDTGAWLLVRAGLLRPEAAFVPPRLAAAFFETFGSRPLAAFGHPPPGQVTTAAGSEAALRLSLEILARWDGDSLADAVAEELGRMRGGAEPADGRLSKRLGVTHERLARCVDAMERNLETPLDKTALARLAGISPRHMERLFLSFFRQTPGAFYRALRLAHARQLLEHTGMPIMEVALATGFLSPSHFARAFLALYGCPPGRFRRERRSRAVEDLQLHLG